MEHRRCMSVHDSLKTLPEWNRLVEMVRELAFLDGGSDEAFTLASGRQSRWFFDMKPVMMHTESSKLLARLFNHRLDALNPDFVGGLELGAVPLTAIVIAGSESNHRKGFMFANLKAEEAENQQPSRHRRCIDCSRGSIVILEDVTTTGVLQFRQWKGFGRQQRVKFLQSSAFLIVKKAAWRHLQVLASRLRAISPVPTSLSR